MSGASLPAFAGGNGSGYGAGVPVSRNMSSQNRHSNDMLLGADGTSGTKELPRPIPAPSGGERGGSLATTPTNTLSSVARAAMTSSALRAQAQVGDASGQRLVKLGYGSADDAGYASSDSKSGTPSPRSRVQVSRVSAHRHRSPRMRQSSISDNGHGSTVSFNLIVLAKSALLRIATADMPLVVSTVIEILQSNSESTSVRERRGALQLIGLVAQKYPRQVHPHLEGIASAIVQAIEPKRATVRKLLIAAAGAALQGLVRAYPWVSFHPESQCLAVGCIDGRCTTYDLRTATRTAVYDGGAGCPVAAVAISPQGDRVASFTLGNGMLSIWDPSPSALAMFARSLFWSATSEIGGGAAESQSSGSVTPSKTMNIPAEYLEQVGDLSATSAMAVAKLTWTADRTVLLQIQEASFSLSV
ncbi:hypothetical protein IWW38_003803 [Coemansia aciculifera]|uniref:Uncharacterized protein n=1 Tax=Coemansia aciculifera TaxID=417176 RepID=A0ACC1LZL7_9FUNG|nr:hypothetical protein IWW38_003803 [Coemansia aciculifera]